MTEPTRPQNPARRRLARGALATPAVLASITAKDALAGKYNCAVSGAMSGNMSHKGRTDSCKDEGFSCQYWKGYCKGSGTKAANCIGLDYKGCSETSGSGKNKVTKLKRSNYDRSSYPAGQWTSATLDHLFNGEDDSTYPVQDRDLVMAGLCAYLNAQYVGDYHITTDDARGLFLGALGKQSFRKDGKSWSSDQCRAHLMALYKEY